MTFTPDNWNAQQTVTVGVKLGAVVGECIINHSDNSGNTADATITVTDSGLRPLPQATLTGVPATLILPEGSMFPYNLDVDPRGGDAVTVVSSSDNNDVEFLGGDGSYVRELTLNYSSATLPRVVTVRAGVDSDAEGSPFKVRHRVGGNNIVVVSAIISDNDRIPDDGLGFAVSPSAQSLPEGGQGEYQVRLSARPRGRTVIHFETASAGSIHIRGPCGGARDLTPLTFTTSNWDQPQTVAFNVCGDGDDGDDIFTLTHRVYNDPSCTDFSGDCETLLVGEVRVQVIDDDTSGLTIDAVGLSILNEGDSRPYTVRMDTPVRREVTVTISSSARSKVRVSPETLTFMAGDWDAPQTVTVDVLEDNDYNDETAVLTHRMSLTSSTFLLRIAVNDNDRRPNFVFGGCDSMAGNECRLSDVPEGASREYSLKLDGPPLENVIVSISSDAPGLVTPSATELTFTPGNWETPQAVTATVGLGAPERAALDHRADGSGYFERTIGEVIVSRDARPGFYFPLCDVPPVFTDVAECDVLVVPQGQSGSYGMRLRRQPASDVLVTVTHEGDSYVALKQTAGGEALTSLEFTFDAGNWNVAQFAHFTAIDSGNTEEVADALVHKANGAGYRDHLVGRFVIRVVDRDRTPPDAVEVRDGLDREADADFNDGSLTKLSANWTFDATAVEYRYAVGSACGAADVAEWTTDWQAETSVTITGLSLRTGLTYYFGVRARDANGNESDVPGGDSCGGTGTQQPSSNGQAVLPLLDVSVSPRLIEAGRVSEDPERTVTLTISTNAHRGFRALMYRTESEAPDFNLGTYDNPAPWTEAARGLAFSVNDCDVNGGKFWSMPGCGGERRFAPVTRDSPGNVIADHPALVDGATGPVMESYEILLRAPTSGGLTNSATTFLIIQAVPEY